MCIVRYKATKLDLPNTSITDIEHRINADGLILSSQQKIQPLVLEKLFFLS